jgi:hypothetical protein
MPDLEEVDAMRGDLNDRISIFEDGKEWKNLPVRLL